MVLSAGASSDCSAKMQNALPQYGFGADVTFGKLVEGNPYLFRVHTPKAHPPHYDGSEPYFVGSKFNNTFSSAAIYSPCPPLASSGSISNISYADVVKHLDWSTRSESPYISTSFSFAWAIWEATRRYHINIKHDVEVAIIDASALADRAVTAAEVLMKGSPKERHKDHWKWYRFALEAQDVLVWGYIPGSAVLASIPLLQIVSRLPSYFLYPDISDSKDSPLARLGWDYTRKKPSFRQFCQAMSDRFLRMPMDKRLRDTTAGSVRLALALLRPYIHRHISDDFTTATTHVCDLAYIISCWPGQWWVREHPEIPDLLRCMIHIVGEEMREARRIQALADATKMQGLVEQLAQAYEARLREQRRRLPPLLSSIRSCASSSPIGSPTEAKSESWSTSSTLITTDSKEVQTDPVLSEKDPVPPSPVESDPRSPRVESDLELDRNESSTYDVVAKTASCFFTGLAIGSFITLCVWSSHRRELAICV
ncbi:unnamed protein product [Somion occarium]|uniref:DUF7587 domain-containing protein n=1 Tax=Somion occarium TaxID=3059160 RepID=A0ABP1DQ87_9APHY